MQVPKLYLETLTLMLEKSTLRLKIPKLILEIPTLKLVKSTLKFIILRLKLENQTLKFEFQEKNHNEALLSFRT